MSRAVSVGLAAAAGVFVGLQAPVNARLGREVGSFQAATISFLVGTVALIVAASLASGGLSGVGHVSRAPWWALIGGLLGAFYVTVALVHGPDALVSALTAIVVTGQLTIAVAIDRFGWLGIARHQIGWSRILGLVLLLVGVVLVVRR
jgi:transporter family-2 protein